MTGIVLNFNQTTFESNASSMTPTITPTVDDTIIVLFMSFNSATASVTGITNTGTGLTWNKRSANTFTGGVAGHSETWWAHQTTHQSIVATVSFAASVGNAECVISAWSGCNLTTPFDVNGSLPALRQINGATTLVNGTTGVSTTAANCAVISMLSVASSIGAALGHSNTGYTNIPGLNNTGDGTDNAIDCSYIVESGTLSGATVIAWNSSELSGSSATIQETIDALQPPTPGTSGTITQTLGGVTQSAAGIVPGIKQTLFHPTQLAAGGPLGAPGNTAFTSSWSAGP